MLMMLSANLAWAGKADCAPCTEIQKLEAEFLALKYEIPKDRANGRGLLPRVLNHFESFEKIARTTAGPEVFKALVRLSAAAAPYDEGSVLAENIAGFMYDNRRLKNVYEQTSSALTDSCRQQLIRTMVDERLCMIGVEERGQADQRPLACVKNPVFRYDHCVGLKSAD